MGIASYVAIVLKAASFVPSTLLALVTNSANTHNKCWGHAYRIPFLANKVMSYVFQCVYFAAYRLSFTYQSCTKNICIIASACQIPSSRVGCVPQQLNFRQNSKFHGHYIESLLGSPMFFSVDSTITFTNAFINHAGSYYMINNFYLIWGRSYVVIFCQAVTQMKFLLHTTSILPLSQIITTISSLQWGITTSASDSCNNNDKVIHIYAYLMQLYTLTFHITVQQ